jgi:hypothetical protein
MTWKGVHPVVEHLRGRSAKGVSVSAEEREAYEARWERSATLPAYEITIRPKIPKYR